MGRGGIAGVSYVLVEYLPDNWSGWQAAICDDTVNHVQTGGFPVERGTPAGFYLGECVGTLTHEFGHTLGLLHPFEAPGYQTGSAVMSIGWQDGAAGVRRALNLTDCSGSFKPNNIDFLLRDSDLQRIYKLRYLNDQTWNDTNDPDVVFSYPRLGTIIDDSATSPSFYISGYDMTSGIYSVTVSNNLGNLYDYYLLDNFEKIKIDSFIATSLFVPQYDFMGYELHGVDNQGNTGYPGTFLYHWYLRRPAHDREIKEVIYVSPTSAGDDETAPEGCFKNPFHNIQSAIDKANAINTVLLMPGMYKITQTLQLKDGVSLIGYGKADEIILDGEGRSIALIEFFDNFNFVMNLHLKNAAKGCVKNKWWWSDYCYFSNLIISDMTQGGIESNNIISYKIDNNTFYNIAGPAVKFDIGSDYGIKTTIKNNIFYNCSKAIEFVQALEVLGTPSTRRLCYNLFYNCQQILSGFPTGVTFSQFEGNQEKDPLFIDASGDNFHLQDASPAVWAGDPLYLDNNGIRTRTLGALEYFGHGLLGAGNSWNLYK